MIRFGAKGGILAAALVAAFSCQATAQSVSDYRLPTSEPTPTRAQGPVDRDNPVIVAPRVEPTAGPAPTPTATPSVAPSSTAPRIIAPPPRTATPLRPAPRITVPTPTGPPTASTEPLPAPALALPPSFPPPEANPSASPVATAESATYGWQWPALGGAIGAMLLGAALFWWRRRKEAAEAEIDFEPPVVAPPAAPEPRPIPAPPAPAILFGSDLEIGLETTRLSATLVNATLSYRLTLTNHGSTALSPVAISADMIAAHASLSREQQLGLDGQRLEHRHSVQSLAPGESTVLSGDIRLPLAAIPTIRSGNATIFVPLARFRVEATRELAAPLTETRAFVIGEPAATGNSSLKPFRLDLGPRVYSQVSQRQL